MARKYKYMRKDFEQDLPATLKHMDIHLSFFDERVEATACLCIIANKDVTEIALDAKELRVISVQICSGRCKDVGEEGNDLDFEHKTEKDMLIVKLPKVLKKGNEVCIRTVTHC